jgi:uncharacterized NAD(P)/FAD-binding protein YdhS
MQKTISIYGFGFAGLVTAYKLVQRATYPLKIHIYDPNGSDGMGVAYRTNCPLHLLNVQAENMGALSEKPEHFYQWMLQQGYKIEKAAFVSRMIYGQYLTYLKGEMLTLAEQKRISVIFHKERAKSVQVPAVIATSVDLTKEISCKEEHLNGYFSSLWPIFTNINSATEAIKSLDNESTVALIGSGLTMLDAVATLHYVDYRGKILIFSERGIVPNVHKPHIKASIKIPTNSSLLSLIHQLHKLAHTATDWRTVIDGLRPHTTHLWQQLKSKEKKQFLRHFLVLWNSFRHRTAPEAYALFDLKQKEGKLQKIKAKITFLKQVGKKIDIEGLQQGEKTNTIADIVINCSGPNYRINESKNPLIQSLLNCGDVKPDDLGYGFAVDKEGRISKQPIYALGSLLMGTLFETTAVPEIRIQCSKVAEALLGTEKGR